ncbi:MAG: DUF1572 family protein [Anaerolineae bacterium]|nr:DUF1572 family protein [Anaerolineae bacterium]
MRHNADLSVFLVPDTAFGSQCYTVQGSGLPIVAPRLDQGNRIPPQAAYQSRQAIRQRSQSPLPCPSLGKTPIGSKHLTGNLNHYFGVGVLENGYVRDRDREFVEGDIPKEKLLADLRAAVEVAKKAAEQVTDEQILRRPYRTPNGEEYESLAYHATRNAMHFALHYGQIDYVKDIVE